MFKYLFLLSISILTFSCSKTDSNSQASNAEDSTIVDSSNAPIMHECVQFQTNWGNMDFWLYNETPIHKAHFLQMVKDSFFNKEVINRIVRNFVIQGGCPDTSSSGHTYYPVQAEFDTTITHVYGALGMGRYGDDVNPDKNSNGCQFYIVTDKNGEHQLDMNYTIFGILLSGDTTLNALNRVKTGDFDDEPADTTINLNLQIIEYEETILTDSFNIKL